MKDAWHNFLRNFFGVPKDCCDLCTTCGFFHFCPYAKPGKMVFLGKSQNKNSQDEVLAILERPSCISLGKRKVFDNAFLPSPRKGGTIPSYLIQPHADASTDKCTRGCQTLLY